LIQGEKTEEISLSFRVEILNKHLIQGEETEEMIQSEEETEEMSYIKYT
jgi:hypothetical protein